MSGVLVIGAGMTPLGRHPGLSVKALTRAAVEAALADAGCAMADIDAAWFSNTRQGVMEGQHGIRGQCALRAMGFEALPIVNCDNACASSATGVNLAVASIRAGMSEVALVVGAEKMYYPDRRSLMFEAFLGGMDREEGPMQMERLLALGAGALPPDMADASGERSIFMDAYAAMARHHMALFGTTPAQLAAVASKNHGHARHNPLAQYRTPMTPEAVLDDRPVSWPLTRAMCAPISDGAAALVLCAESARHRFAGVRPVRLRASRLASGVSRAPDDLARHVGRLAALAAYEEAGVGPRDVDVAEVHDATAFAEIRHVENLGLCEIGAGGPFSAAGHTRLGGRVPVNPSGGLIAKGHPIAATGAIQLYELVAQLRGEAGARQVEGARIAVAENGGGFYDGEEAVAAVTVLERVGAP